jgi:hypothetical protein
MPRTLRTSIPAPVLGLFTLTLALGLTACGGDNDPVFEDEASASASANPSEQPEADPTDSSKSCQAIAGSGAAEDIQAVFDKYKNNSKPFTPADEQKMRDALDLLAKAGDNATPKIREDVVTLVADIGSVIDAREGLPGVGKVATPAQIQRQIDALCR